jgi:general L-amino acid transport system permease protein
MTVTTEAPKVSFRIDMLWTDSRYRSTFLQIIALFVVLMAGYFLVNNVTENLAALGKEFSFGFMSGPSSYDINQRLIEYTSRSSHSTAAVVGLLNTLLIAVMGCILATFLGVTAGVLRLSNNWIVSRLMTVYIEGVRNIPVLIQILLISAALDETLPQPRDFRGEDATASMLLNDSVAFTNRGFYFPMPTFMEGSLYVVLAFIASVCVAIWFGRWATRRQQATGEHLPEIWIKLGIVGGVTLLAYLVMGLPIGLEHPELKGFNFKGGLYARTSLVALWLALSIYTGAFIAENVRAGIQAVSHGQTEAAFALGLQPGRTMTMIILPQAMRVIIPPLISQYLNLTKNSSLALAIGYMDVTGTLGGITLNQTGKEFETLMLLMAFYLTISLSISFVMNLYNEQVKLVERTSVAGGGFSVLALFAGVSGKWEVLKKGDARMQPNYGVASWLNLVVLLYGATLAMMLYYVFLDSSEGRDSYYLWSTSNQIISLLLIIFSAGTFVTAIFKHYRFIDFVGVELVIFILAVLIGLPFGEITGVGTSVFVFGGLAARLATIGYTVFGARPNVTYFYRVREGSES